MKIQYLGTAAAEGYPALFCECENCTKAKKLGGKNIRSRSQALIDDKLLIDYNADTNLHYLTHKFDLPNIKHCLITHGHHDHFYPMDILARSGPVNSHLKNESPTYFYSPKDVYEKIVALKQSDNIKDIDLIAVKVEPYKTYTVGEYLVTPLPAVHAGYNVSKDDGSVKFKYYPVTYIIEKDGKSMLYHHDSDFYAEETFEFLKNRKKPFDLVSFDCTNGLLPKTYVGHLGLNECVDYKNEFIKNGLATDKTIFVVNHFSHNGTGTVYNDMKITAEKVGFIASYDGMTLEF